MGNTHLREMTRKKLQNYADKNEYNSLDGAVIGLLEEHNLLIVTQQKCELLENLFKPYKLDEE